MRYKFVVLLLGWVTLLHSCQQDSEDWMWFENQETELIGYKDAEGTIKIPAKFSLVYAQKFKHIIAVTEKIREDSASNYYLLKNGRKIGIDSTYLWDMSYDCEQESKIRFRDKITDEVGFFDREGKVVIPAVYNDALPFYNGLALVKQNAKRICWEGGEFSATNLCEHWSWQGGKTLLINESSQALLDFTAYKEIMNLDWYSLEISDQPLKADTRINFKGINGKYYSFLDTQKQFTSWFYEEFLSTTKSKASRLKDYCFTEIAVSANFEDEAWKHYPQQNFLEQYTSALLKRVKVIEPSAKNIAISPQDLNPYIFDSEHYKIFYNDCGEHKKEEYPAFNVIVSHYAQEKLAFQEHFEFLRTQHGYKLISISIENQQ